MTKKQPSQLSDLLRQRLAECDIPHLRIKREAGVSRDSLRRFLRGEQSMQLDAADKLADYLGLELVDKKKR